MSQVDENQITVLFEGWDSGLELGDFYDPVDLFPQLADDGVRAVNVTPYCWSLNHRWFDSDGGEWLDLVREHQDRRCYVVSDLERTFDYGLVWYLE